MANILHKHIYKNNMNCKKYYNKLFKKINKYRKITISQYKKTF